MEKELINNLLRVTFPQYALVNFSIGNGSTRTVLYDEDTDDDDDDYDNEILAIDIYSQGNPKMFVYFSRATSEDIDVLVSIFDMDSVGLASFEIRGIK